MELYEYSEDILAELNNLLRNPKEFIDPVKKMAKAKMISATKGEELVAVLELMLVKKKKRLILFSEKISQVGFDLQANLSNVKGHAVFSNVPLRLCEELNSFIESVELRVNGRYDPTEALIILLASNIAITKRILTEENFEHGAVTTYPAYKGNKERSILLLTRKISLNPSDERIAKLSYFNKITVGVFLYNAGKSEIEFLLEDGTSRKEAFELE